MRTYKKCRFSNSVSYSHLPCHVDGIYDTNLRHREGVRCRRDTQCAIPGANCRRRESIGREHVVVGQQVVGTGPSVPANRDDALRYVLVCKVSPFSPG
jgi:hypothetical protein